MSKTDKTRPYQVAYEDPYNRRFRMVGIRMYSSKARDRGNEWPWKKLTSCHDSNCCDGWWKKDERRKARTQKRKELTRLRQTPMVDWFEYE